MTSRFPGSTNEFLEEDSGAVSLEEYIQKLSNEDGIPIAQVGMAATEATATAAAAMAQRICVNHRGQPLGRPASSAEDLLVEAVDELTTTPMPPTAKSRTTSAATGTTTSTAVTTITGKKQIYLAVPGLAYKDSENVSPIKIPKAAVGGPVARSLVKGAMVVDIKTMHTATAGTTAKAAPDPASVPAPAPASAPAPAPGAPSKKPRMEMIRPDKNNILSFTFGAPAQGCGRSSIGDAKYAVASTEPAPASAPTEPSSTGPAPTGPAPALAPHLAPASAPAASTIVTSGTKRPSAAGTTIMSVPTAANTAAAATAAGTGAVLAPAVMEKKQRTKSLVELGCKCRGSACLKLYCDCFQSGKVCGASCVCVDCKNTMQHSRPGGARIAAIMETLSRCPDAFSLKRADACCSCDKNNCLNNYCACFSNGRQCEPGKCSCRECLNTPSAMMLSQPYALALAQLNSMARLPQGTAGASAHGIMMLMAPQPQLPLQNVHSTKTAFPQVPMVYMPPPGNNGMPIAHPFLPMQYPPVNSNRDAAQMPMVSMAHQPTAPMMIPMQQQQPQMLHNPLPNLGVAQKTTSAHSAQAIVNEPGIQPQLPQQKDAPQPSEKNEGRLQDSQTPMGGPGRGGWEV